MAQPDLLDVRVLAEDGRETTVVEAAGELDFTSINQLRDVLLPLLEQGAVVLDASEIDFCDSVGLQVILEAQHAARRHGTDFRLAAPSTQLIRVMDLAGALKVVKIFPDTESARGA